ncbi:G-protein coupled receptor moody-like [Strongylocentrotus purpuratus]|uniref:G-protein coupled receptors family 1 profile domain-containing protein n=1 Tax=Strongylocentrotus purpuratus TaxID=7668 RepID=A0A7M7SUU8_STRPU|nr:G-protein coupled receptor moody-like [Strongylocentrotus purpuratus]
MATTMTTINQSSTVSTMLSTSSSTVSQTMEYTEWNDTAFDTTMNMTTMTTTKDPLVSDTEALIMSIFLNIIALLGIVGNSIVIVSVVFSRKLQTVTNVFIIALCVTDLLVCITLPFQTFALISQDGWPLADWLCAAIGGITSICFGASVLLLVLIAFNRYFVITRPRSTCQRLYKPRNLFLMVASTYIYTFIMFAVLPLADIGMLGYSESYRICSWDDEHELSEVNDIIVGITFSVSFVVIVVCYIRIFLFIKKHHRAMLSHRSPSEGSVGVDNEFTSTEQTETQLPPPRSHNAASSNISEGRKVSGIKTVVLKREVEITKNLLMVIVSFFICIAPYSVSLLLPKGNSLSIFTGILLMFNTCINPMIYSFKHPTFKVVIRCVVGCRYADIPKPSLTLKKLLKLGRNAP